LNKIKKQYLFFIFVLTFFINCDIGTGTVSTNTKKIYSSSFGYDVAYRIIDNKVYSGGYGYDVAYRIDGNKNIFRLLRL
jgi:hypothetical protein